jgi:acetyl coenzyme A synthetase (ADP forming)-like protein
MSIKWDLGAIFHAKSIAIVGASREPDKIGHVILRSLLRGFKGRIYPVNPNANAIAGLKCYKSVTDIPGELDCAVIAVPAKFVPGVMEECGKKGVRGAVIISGGFSETGNKALEDELRAVANKHKIAVIGPNCLGVLDNYTHVDTMFNPQYKMNRPRQGGISFISQSGAVGAVVMDWAGFKGFGVDKFISYGNALNVDEVDLLEYLGKDPKTKVICAYFEGTRRGKELMRMARKVGKKKPIIAIKAGRSEAGARAVSSHTGSLAGSDAVWDAAFKQAGVIRAKGVDDMFDYARVFAEQPLPKGKRVAIVTNGGGFGVLATDSSEYYGLEMAKLSPKSELIIKARVPEYAIVKNPVDLVGDADRERYEVALNALMEDPNVDSIICIILMQTANLDSSVVDVIAELSDRRKKPIICASGGGEYANLHMKLLEEAGVPTYDTLRAAARSLAALTNYEKFISSK